MDQPARRLVMSVSDLPPGAHLCHFYETLADLLDTLVPYFKAGLERHEYCLWVTSAESVAEATGALSRALPELDRHLAERNLEIIDSRSWYLQDGVFDASRVLDAWRDKLDQALARGYTGMRINGNEDWLDAANWPQFHAYERRLDDAIRGTPTIVLCSYPLSASGGIQVLDVARTHQFVLARRKGAWERIESPVFRTCAIDAAREEERARIARELHDEIGSALTGIKWDLEAASHAAGAVELHPAVRGRLDATAHQVDAAIESLCRLSHELRPVILDDLGLVPAVEWLSEQFEASTGITTRLDALLDEVDVGPDQATVIFRIIQEALTNIRRHARASRTDILLEERDGTLLIEVRDDGIGVRREEVDAASSLGMMGMRERAALIDGAVTIEPGETQGTRVTLQIPVRRTLRPES